MLLLVHSATKKINILVLGFILLNAFCHAQSDTLRAFPRRVNVSAYLDGFFVHDLNKPSTKTRQPFFYNYNRHNQPAINLAFVKLNVEKEFWRTNLALQAGTYVRDNYQKETPLLRCFLEANAGIVLRKKKGLWLDAGIMPSHLGFESAVGADNWTLTRSLLAENSPYFLTGLKMSWTPDSVWLLSALVTTGWQRIQMAAGNTFPGFGSQVSRKLNHQMLINWSTFVGTEDRNTERRMRYFSNLYTTVQFDQHFDMILGFDYGIQQVKPQENKFNTWWSPVALLRYTISRKLQLAWRAEYYSDRAGVIIQEPSAFETAGFSMNVDYAPTALFLLRAETRLLQSPTKIYPDHTTLSNKNWSVALSLSFKIAKSVQRLK